MNDKLFFMIFVLHHLFPFCYSGYCTFQVGTYAAVVKRRLIICAIRVHILYAKGALKTQIIYVYEEIKGSVEHA